MRLLLQGSKTKEYLTILWGGLACSPYVFLWPFRGDGTEGGGVLHFLFIASQASCFRAIVLCACFFCGASFISKSFLGYILLLRSRL